MGRKFGLAKFYFGLIRFVCDLLMVTAKLNNNNTEFVVGGGGGWWVRTHNVVKPTFTWLWLSWVLTILLTFHNNLLDSPNCLRGRQTHVVYQASFHFFRGEGLFTNSSVN